MAAVTPTSVTQTNLGSMTAYIYDTLPDRDWETIRS